MTPPPLTVALAQAPIPAGSAHPEVSLHAALELVVELKTESLRYSLMRCFERATRWENRPSIREPGAYPSIRRRFQPLFDQLRNAGTRRRPCS